MEDVTNVPILDKDDYYKDVEWTSFSDIKLFSFCETLFRDTRITKEYEEGDKTYFTYGKLVDALLTESPKYVEDNFILVERKIKVEDALKHENQIKELENYINDPVFLEKVAKGNQVALKGLEKRQKEIIELKMVLENMKSLDSKIQITPALWREAEESALAIKTHPSFVTFVFNELTSQQIIKVTVDGIKRKGRLDHLKLSPEITKIYAIFVAEKITYDEMIAKIKALNPNDHWAIVTDIKTCYDIEKLEPYNDHYRGQLAYYRTLVSEFFQIPKYNVRGRILAGDKVTQEFKKSELFEYTKEALDEREPWINEWVNRLAEAKKTGKFISDKEKNGMGMGRGCFKCTECRFCPFSAKPGEAVLISSPRFSKRSDIIITGAGEPIQIHDILAGEF